MAEPARKLALTYDAYLAIERETDTRHELLNGEAWAMAGGTPRHSALKANVVALFRALLHGRPCRPYDSDLKIRVPDTGLATYPDLSVICGPLARDPEDRNAVTNPTLLVEVLSPSTEAWDRGGKFAHAQRLASLNHYVLVDADRASVEHYARQEDGSWRYTRHTAGGAVRFADLGVELAVDDVYADLPEEPSEEDAASGV